MERQVNVVTVLEAIRTSGLHEFSTFEIAELMGVAEYPVRAAMSWLLKAREIKKFRTVRRYTATAREAYWATTYLLVEKGASADWARLNKVFVFGF